MGAEPAAVRSRPPPPKEPEPGGVSLDEYHGGSNGGSLGGSGGMEPRPQPRGARILRRAGGLGCLSVLLKRGVSCCPHGWGTGLTQLVPPPGALSAEPSPAAPQRLAVYKASGLALTRHMCEQPHPSQDRVALEVGPASGLAPTRVRLSGCPVPRQHWGNPQGTTFPPHPTPSCLATGQWQRVPQANPMLGGESIHPAPPHAEKACFGWLPSVLGMESPGYAPPLDQLQGAPVGARAPGAPRRPCPQN